ncbi:MAG: NADH dehydrogenase [Eubacterium sp.]|nr:NADH dehydrogenase [Eubacterium sp.]
MRFYLPGICGYGLSFQLDGFRVVFATLAVLAWTMALIASMEYMKHDRHPGRYYFFTFVTLFATLGVFLSADFFTALIFFEIMSFTSYTWVAQTEKEAALRAADTYLAVAVIGGLAILMGLFLLYHMYGTLDFEELGQLVQGTEPTAMRYAAGVCILIGFGAKAGIFPLHIWLPKAHPVAPAPASALLSGMLTKCGIFGAIVLVSRLFAGDQAWGTLILVLGACTMFLGALLAVFAMDLKRTLACSSVSQIGFITVGVGMCDMLFGEHALAAHGTILHMINHSLIKLVLFLAAGVVYMNTHELDLNKIRGFGRKKPYLAGCFLAGALAIGGIPLFSGYISKTLLHESILEYGGGGWIKFLEIVFIFSGGLTIAYMTKLFVTVFIEKNTDAALQERYDANRKYMKPFTAAAIGIPAAGLLLWGWMPRRLMDMVADFGSGFFALAENGEAVHYFNGENLLGAVYSIVIGALVYLFFIRGVLMKKNDAGAKVLVNRWPDWLDLENTVYRPLLLRFLPCMFGFICRIFDSLVDLIVVLLRKTIYRDTPLPRYYSEGNALTRAMGKVLNLWRDLGNRTWRRSHPVDRDYVHLLAVKSDEIAQNNVIITRSISFGLFLFGVGFCLMLFYVIAGDLHF